MKVTQKGQVPQKQETAGMVQWVNLPDCRSNPAETESTLAESNQSPRPKCDLGKRPDLRLRAQGPVHLSATVGVQQPPVD
jgi:hypothetical protein